MNAVTVQHRGGDRFGIQIRERDPVHQGRPGHAGTASARSVRELTWGGRGGARPTVSTGAQDTLSAVSSMTNEVWSETSSTPRNLTVTVWPANADRLNDFWL